jgi:hypothetical protein
MSEAAQPKSTDKLPTELLEEIFTIACCDGSDAKELEEFCLNLNPGCHPAWVLSQVCSRWRALSLAIPKLWSRIEIQVIDRKDLSPESIARMKHLATLFLSRSGESPLDLTLAIPSKKAALDRSFVATIAALSSLESLLSSLRQIFHHQSYRWRYASLCSYERCYDLGGCFMLPYHLPRLERLEINLTSHFFERVNPELAARFQPFSAPLLQTLSLSGKWKRLEDPGFFSMVSLKDLTISNDPISCREILALSSPSTTVTFSDFSDVYDDNGVEFMPLTARALIINPIFCSTATRAMVAFFSQLSFAEIKEIIFGRSLPSAAESMVMEVRSQREIPRVYFPARSFYELLERSSVEKVTRLTIHHYALSGGALVTCLRHLPCLVYLDVDERPIPELALPDSDREPDYSDAEIRSLNLQLLSGMKVSSSLRKNHVLPHLTELSFSFDVVPPHMAPFIIEELLAMLESRVQSNGSGLQGAQVTIEMGVISESRWARINHLRAQGLHAQVHQY